MLTSQTEGSYAAFLNVPAAKAPAPTATRQPSRAASSTGSSSGRRTGSSGSGQQAPNPILEGIGEALGGRIADELFRRR